MAKPIVMPQVGQDLEEGKLVEWRVKLGDTIKKGDVVAVVESEKASFEVEAYESGKVVTLVYEEGATTKVLSPLLFVEAEGEAPAAPAAPASAKEAPAAPAAAPSASVDAAAVEESEVGGSAASAPASPATAPAGAAPAPASQADAAAVAESEVAEADVGGGGTSGGKAGRSSPLARRAARAAGIELVGLTGTGPRGAVVMRDIQAAIGSRGAPARAETPGVAPTPAAPVAPAPAPAAPERAAPVPMPAAAAAAPGALNRAWLRRGEGDPIVMLHGFGGDLNAWRVLAGAADFRRPILAVDLPGHGGSPDGGATLADLAAAVAAALDEEGVTAADLVGHSLGAAVAVALAETARFTARSLFLLSPAGLGPDINGAFLDGFTRARSEAALAPWMRLLVADEAAVGPALVRITAEARAKPGVADAQARIAGALFPDGTQGFDVRRALGALPMPVRVVFGAADRIVPARHCAALPGTVAVHTLPGVGHMPFLEAREAVARILAEHLRSAA